MIRKFLPYYKPHLKLLSIDLVSAFFISVISLVFPMLTKHFIDSVIPEKDMSLVIWFGVLMLILYLVMMGLEYIVGYYGHLLGVHMEYDMRREIFTHVQTLSFPYFDKTKKGEILSRVVNDLVEVPEMAHHGPEDFFLSTIKIIGAFVLLCTINVKLTLIIFAIIPILFWFMTKYNNKLSKTFSDLQETLADVFARIEDSVSGIKVVQSFTNEEYEKEKFDQGNNKFKKVRSRAVQQIGVFDSGVNFLSNLSLLITLVASGLFVINGEISIGDLVAYLMYIALFLQPLQILQRFVEQYQRGIAGFKRFVSVMAIKPEVVSDPEAMQLGSVDGAIAFEQVSFKYDSDATVLKNINLDIAPGETVALVGPSGIGKTTLCHLIPRFYDVSEGRITVDGIDVRDVALASLRQQIGIVQQDVFLFSGTVKENIAYGRLDANDEEIIQAATAANAHEFIMALPDQYDTYIGERGARLSGGQKQRISIARMFLKNPAVLIFDEATSSLDNRSEAMIKQAIEELSKDRTTLIIAHRLATIKHADRIIVLSEDGIVEQGHHTTLMANKGAYYRLYESQFQMA